MATILIHKPLGGRLTQFRVKGQTAAQAHRVVAQHVIVMRVYLNIPNYDERYVFDIQHLGKGKMVEAICVPDGYVGKAALIDAIHGAVLAVEDDPHVKQAVEQLRADVIAEVQRFRPFPSELEIVCGRQGPSCSSQKD